MRTVGLTIKRQPETKLTKADVIKQLEERGIEFDKRAKLDELKVLLDAGGEEAEDK